MTTTTLLGVTYRGRPMMNSLAFALWRHEQEGHPEKARELLAAHNQVRSAFDNAPIDLGDDFTTAPMEGLQRVPAGKLRDSRDCPGHVARDDDAKVCPHCGTHVESERPIDDIVTRTARAA